jgi:XTP/dITP diphosphohydrolase
MTLVFATANKNKVREINDILSDANKVNIVSMADIGCHADIPETTGTIRGNAIQKATYLWYNYRVDCFSEDTGLEIDALDGAPGVDTAHYAGTRDADANIALVLNKMGDTDLRTARFRTVIALIAQGKLHIFEGVCEGTIRREKSLGTEGFGYDPIFQPYGYGETFAELGLAVKSQISHRSRAMKQLLKFLKTQ